MEITISSIIINTISLLATTIMGFVVYIQYKEDVLKRELKRD